MLSRRHLLLLPLGVLLPLPTEADAATEQAADFVRHAGESLIDIINSNATPAVKQTKLAAIIDRDVDVLGIGQFCLGRFWRLASPAQRAAYLKLFHRILVNSISARLGEYQGVRFSLGETQKRAIGIVVKTTIQRPHNAPNDVEWLVEMLASGPKIEDMIVEGTSLRLTQRSDYASFLAQNGNQVQALINALERKLDSGSG